jgi:hypothetical protein
MAMSRLGLRFRIRRIMVVVAIVGVILALAKSLFIDNSPDDIVAAVIGAMGGNFTVYAEGYSESNFHSIRAGMTVRQVEEIMGPPLVKGQWQVPDGIGPSTPGEVPLDDIWYYTRAGKPVQEGTASHWRRAVLFRNGVVWRTDRTYWLD